LEGNGVLLYFWALNIAAVYWLLSPANITAVLTLLVLSPIGTGRPIYPDMDVNGFCLILNKIFRQLQEACAPDRFSSRTRFSAAAFIGDSQSSSAEHNASISF
jgi:hypothetical protein